MAAKWSEPNMHLMVFFLLGSVGGVGVLLILLFPMCSPTCSAKIFSINDTSLYPISFALSWWLITLFCIWLNYLGIIVGYLKVIVGYLKVGSIIGENSKSNIVCRLWLKIGRPSILTHILNDEIQLFKIAMIQMLRSIENKRTFNNLSFM